MCDLRVALAIVLLEDVSGHKVRRIVEDARLALESGSSSGDQTGREGGVARWFGPFLQNEDLYPALGSGECRDHPTCASADHDQGSVVPRACIHWHSTL